MQRRHLREMLARLGLLQIDSVNALVRSHYLPFFSRLGAYPREMVPGAAVLVITSDIGLMSHSGIVDRVVMLRDGRVIADDEAAAVLGSDDPYISRFLGAYLGR